MSKTLIEVMPELSHFMPMLPQTIALQPLPNAVCILLYLFDVLLMGRIMLLSHGNETGLILFYKFSND